MTFCSLNYEAFDFSSILHLKYHHTPPLLSSITCHLLRKLHEVILLLINYHNIFIFLPTLKFKVINFKIESSFLEQKHSNGEGIKLNNRVIYASYIFVSNRILANDTTKIGCQKYRRDSMFNLVNYFLLYQVIIFVNITY